MTSIAQLQILRAAYHVGAALSPDEALARIGNPDPEALVEAALAHLASGDRNVRVLALRVLAHQHGARAMQGVLAGLRDERRRVCAVAIQACPNYLEYRDIAAQLETIARDASRKRKLRRRALSMLAGDEGRMPGDLTAAQAECLRRLMLERDYRFPIVFGLARLETRARTQALLEEFAASDDAQERDMAARAMSGVRIIHIDRYADNASLHAAIMRRCDIAHGRMYYWLPRDGLPTQSE